MGEDDNGVTLGELARRMDRMTAAIAAQLLGVRASLDALGPDLATTRTMQVEVVRRLGSLEQARASSEARLRTNLAAALIAILSAVAAILVGVVGVH